ncbi:MAG: triphosphoribosyl-dephospho-CoA synthase [Gammaproteobacteria bacterium]|nr:triphosphoribosyl-dephospho-CoA synthase [Gammaproteobacteria bacterium]
MLSTETIQECIVWACEQEVTAPKPGNVNCYGDGHNMKIQDFISSAHAIAPALSKPGLAIGDMILQAIKATRTVVNCNTNLGIVLLFAPLCKAIQNCSQFEQLPSALNSVLQNLTVEDAAACYQAIRLAEPGGMGTSEQQDINDVPTVTLRQAMALAEQEDTIAAQYLNNYHEILHIGLSNLTSAINCGESVEWASALAYLKILSSVPDTLICRKYGLECAREVMENAKQITCKASETNTLQAVEPFLIAWDNELKKKEINPGTTADMTAATLLVYAFEQALS